MQNTRELQAAYGLRFETLLQSSPDPKAAMDEMAEAAEHAGLIDNPSNLRRDDPMTFVSDLWSENPAVHDRLNLSRESLPRPNAVTTLNDVLDVLQ